MSKPPAWHLPAGRTGYEVEGDPYAVPPKPHRPSRCHQCHEPLDGLPQWVAATWASPKGEIVGAFCTEPCKAIWATAHARRILGGDVYDPLVRRQACLEEQLAEVGKAYAGLMAKRETVELVEVVS